MQDFDAVAMLVPVLRLSLSPPPAALVASGMLPVGAPQLLFHSCSCDKSGCLPLCCLHVLCSPRVLRTRVGSGPIFAEHHITASMAKVRLMDLQETVQVRRVLSCMQARMAC
jgi:hypothetical protein